MPLHFDITRFHGSCIHQELLVTNWEAYKALHDIKTRKAAGPDGIHSVVLKLFAFEPGPVVADLYNSMLREGFIPPLLKSSIVHPLPKVTPPKCIEDDVRPISLTCRLAKVLEGFTLARALGGLFVCYIYIYIYFFFNQDMIVEVDIAIYAPL